MAMSLCKDLVFLILQFCDEENLKRTAHMLEQETGYFFDLKYFEELVLNGNWEEAEKYLSSFTVVEDNKYSTKIYFEIRKQKYLEALDNHEFSVALDILLKELKVFGQSNKELYKEMAQLLALDDFRDHNSLTFYGDTSSARKRIINDLRTVIEANPLLQGRTRFPQINKSRLRRLVNQSLNWQHMHCAQPHPQPHIDTLFTDHKCPGPDNMQDQLNKETSLPSMDISTSNQSSATDSNITTTDGNLGNLSNQVGKSVGDIELWDVASAQKLFKREFMASGVLLIDAHVGCVNDIAFSKPHDKFVVISCGDDKLIQVWDAVTGAKQYTFKGHGAPVYSLCPHAKKDVHWNEREGFIIRNYHGLSKISSAMVRFDTSTNRFLAAGDEHSIKIWDMDNSEILAVLDADGDLPARPYICFNKKGNLLAVSADDNQIKILANDNGHELLQTSAIVSGDLSGYLTESFSQLSVYPTPVPLKAVFVGGNASKENVFENVKPQGPAVCTKMEMPSVSRTVEISRCESILLPSEVKTNMVWRLAYTHAGNGILALGEDGSHLLWKWVESDANLSGKATTKCAPEVFQPKNGLIMANDLPEDTNDEVTPSFSLSKNDKYLVSTSGRMVTLYSTLTFKIVVWDCVKWEKKKSTVLQIPGGWSDDDPETKIQLDKDQTHFLAIHETQLAIYETMTLQLVKQWAVAKFFVRICNATYSCDGKLIYAVMSGGIILILDALDLAPRFEIDRFAYLPPHVTRTQPVVVAAHPQKPYQFAVGLTNGDVVVVEPLHSEAKWNELPVERI
ncbi:hypothetical protein DH2020_046530 [Rehmannia glutinosa]|uniref:CTLH domain-containing protein n=1 Tax=Rehmannia glutinosa TaxID=99300 RepID=A0ABR0UCK9_REHGL